MKLHAIIAAAAVSTGIAAGPASAETYLSIASNPVGNTAYQWAAGIAELANRNVENVSVTAEGTKGYLANIELFINDQVEAAFTNTKLAYEVYAAAGPYEGREEGTMLSWISVAPIYMHVVVPADSDIQNFEDLRGKRIGIGQAGGISMMDAEVMLETYGMTAGDDYDDFRVPLPQMASMIADGQIDALIWEGTAPLPPLLQLQATNEFRLLDMPEDLLADMAALSPAYETSELPAGSYEGQDEAVATHRLGNVLVIRNDVPEEIVYGITKAVMENLEFMGNVHPAWIRVTPGTVLTGFNAPLHPGALRYFREAELPGIEDFVERVGEYEN